MTQLAAFEKTEGRLHLKSTNMKKSIISIIIILSTFFPLFAQNTNLRESDLALIREAFHLQKELAHKVWADWEGQNTALLYKKGEFKYLFSHNNPPTGYTKLDNNEYLICFYKDTKDTLEYSAMSPVNNIPTVVVSSPGNGYSKSEWVLKTVHEMFHVYQSGQITTGLLMKHDFREGLYENTNEMNFPYPFFDKEMLAIEKLEAEKVYRGIMKDSLNENNILIFKRRFADICFIQQLLVKDSLQVKYKAYMEWNEGVARYVEQQLAIRASIDDVYSPTREYQKLHPDDGFENIGQRYQRQSSLNPIRFVGKGVIGRVMFYYMGMGKAFLLDRIKPDWKKHYFMATLDEQIIGEEQFLTCKNYLRSNPKKSKSK